VSSTDEWCHPHTTSLARKCGGAFHCLILRDPGLLNEVPKIKKNAPELKKRGNEHITPTPFKYVLRKRRWWIIYSKNDHQEACVRSQKRFAYPAPQKPAHKGQKYLIYPFSYRQTTQNKIERGSGCDPSFRVMIDQICKEQLKLSETWL